MATTKKTVCIFIDPVACGDYMVERFHHKNIEVLAVFTNCLIEFYGKFSTLTASGIHAEIAKLFSKNHFDAVYYEWKYADSEKFFANLFKRYHVLQVINANDYSLAFANKLAIDFSLPSNPIKTINLLQSKYELNEFCRKKHINVCSQIQISRKPSSKTLNKIGAMEFPLFAKPIRSCGTVNAKKINDKPELKSYFESMADYPVVIQEFLHGDEYFIDITSFHGVHKVSLVGKYKKILVNNSPIYISAENVPFDNPKARAIIKYVLSILNAIGWQNGLTHTEVMFTGKGPILVEVNPRSSGCHNFMNKLAYYAYGRDQFNFAAEFLSADDDCKHLNLAVKPRMYCMFVCLNNTHMRETMGKFLTKRIAALPSYKENIMLFAVGEKLSIEKDMRSLIGFVLLCGEKQQVKKDTKIIDNLIKRDLLFSYEGQ